MCTGLLLHMGKKVCQLDQNIVNIPSNVLIFHQISQQDHNLVKNVLKITITSSSIEVWVAKWATFSET